MPRSARIQRRRCSAITRSSTRWWSPLRPRTSPSWRSTRYRTPDALGSKERGLWRRCRLWPHLLLRALSPPAHRRRLAHVAGEFAPPARDEPAEPLALSLRRVRTARVQPLVLLH